MKRVTVDFGCFQIQNDVQYNNQHIVKSIVLLIYFVGLKVNFLKDETPKYFEY